MVAVVITLVQILLAVYALVDCLRTAKTDLPGRLPRAFWLLIIILLPLLGPLAWIVISWASKAETSDGRVEIPKNPLEIFRGGAERSESREPEIPQAPDDNPDFLFSIEAKMRRERLAREAEEEAKKRATKNQPPAANDQKSTGSIEDSIASGDISPAPEGDEGETNPGSNPPEEASSPE